MGGYWQFSYCLHCVVYKTQTRRHEMTASFLRVLAQHRDEEVRLTVASNPETPEDALENMCYHDRCAQVRNIAEIALAKRRLS